MNHLCQWVHFPPPTDPTRGHPPSGPCAPGDLPRHSGRPQSQPFPAWPLSLQLPDLCKTPHHHIVLSSLHSCLRASDRRRCLRAGKQIDPRSFKRTNRKPYAAPPRLAPQLDRSHSCSFPTPGTPGLVRLNEANRIAVSLVPGPYARLSSP